MLTAIKCNMTVYTLRYVVCRINMLTALHLPLPFFMLSLNTVMGSYFICAVCRAGN